MNGDTKQEHYHKLSNMNAGVWFTTLIIIFICIPTILSIEGDLWDGSNYFIKTVITINLMSFYSAIWCYSKSKGYSGIFGVLAIILIGPLYLLLIGEKTKRKKK